MGQPGEGGLQGDERPIRAEYPGGTDWPEGGFEDAGGDEDERPSVRERLAGATRYLVPLVAGIVLLAGWLTGASRSDDGEIDRAGSLDAFDIQQGDCLDLPDSDEDVAEVQAVPCDEPHEGEVYALPTLAAGPDAPFPDEVSLIEQSGDACYRAFEPFVGQPYDLSSLDFRLLNPSQDSWGRGRPGGRLHRRHRRRQPTDRYGRGQRTLTLRWSPPARWGPSPPRALRRA